MNTIDLITVMELKPSELTEELQNKVRRICDQEKRNIDNIRFVRDYSDEALMSGFDMAGNCMKMFDGNEFTCWTYFIDDNTID